MKRLKFYFLNQIKLIIYFSLIIFFFGFIIWFKFNLQNQFLFPTHQTQETQIIDSSFGPDLVSISSHSYKSKDFSKKMSSNEKVYSTKEVETHSTEQSAWVIIEGGVYDVTEFLEDHPGGKEILLSNCGKDSTELFEEYHTKKILVKTGGPMKIGVIGADSKM